MRRLRWASEQAASVEPSKARMGIAAVIGSELLQEPDGMIADAVSVSLLAAAVEQIEEGVPASSRLAWASSVLVVADRQGVCLRPARVGRLDGGSPARVSTRVDAERGVHLLPTEPAAPLTLLVHPTSGPRRRLARMLRSRPERRPGPGPLR